MNKVRNNFEFIKKLSWKEVFGFWRENEGEDSSWFEVAQAQGFETWEKWRLEKYALPLGCAEAKWKLYKIKNPLKTIPDFFGGPFSVWIKNYYKGKKTKKFKELIGLSALKNHKKINKLSRNYPINSTIICLQTKNGDIYTIEGMHRCCALALLAFKGEKFDQEILVAIGELDKEVLLSRK